MLRHLGLGCFDMRILFRCRPSLIPLRSIHHVPSSSCHRPPPSDLPPATAKDPGWVMLNKEGIRTDNTFVADAKTVAYARTSTGHHLRVSFQATPPPASSFVHYDFPDSVPGEEDDSPDTLPDGDDGDTIAGECEEEDEDDDDGEEEEEYDVDDFRISVVATHGHSVLLRMSHRRFSDFENDHFLYRRAGGAASPTVMSLLHERDFLTKAEQVYAHLVYPPIRPKLRSGLTCLLQRGDDDVLLVELDLLYDRSSRREMVEFCLLRHGSSEWELKDPVPIMHDDEDDNGDEHLRTRCDNTIIPLSDRLICWVRYECGFLLCDIGDEAASPKVRYVPLPPGVCWDARGYEKDMTIKYSMNMGAAGARAVRFVSVDPHCCCGGPGKTTCAHSRYAFTINSWTMKNLGMDEPLTWVKDGEIDCEELWGLPGYEGLPRANLMCPIVSLDDPSVVCFLVSNDGFVWSYEDLKLWMIQFNINTKTLLSSVPYTNDKWGAYCHFPATLLC